MAGLGSACLAAGLLAALYAVVAGIHAGRGGGRRWADSARRAIYCLAGLLVLATVVLQAAYLRSDFEFALVADNSSTDTPLFYKLTAMWSSQAGSLLLWALLMSVFASIALRVTRNTQREVVPWATAVLGGVASFFLVLMVFYESPFETLASPPAEGAGLNPLLRHPAMMFHPPMLYTGYVAFAVPFAFCIGALVTRRTGADWIRSTRRFALIAWTFLGFGIMLGALWSFAELGWGGYWGWDPVENASLLPWLVGTAFIHSIQVEEKRGMLRVWNVSLIIATFLLSLLGTFLVRSGILESIHAFGASTLGKPFLAFIAFAALGSVALVVSRLDSLRSRAQLDSLFSREAAFLLNNLVLVGLAFVVFWGTFFPLISEAVTGDKASVGPPWFSRYTVPLALVLVLLAGIGPVLTWRRVTPAALRRVFAAPVAVAVIAAVLLVVLTRAEDNLKSLAMFGLVAFVLAVVVQEFSRGVAARRVMTGERVPAALGRLVARNRRRYGGYVVHAGIAVLFLGVAASSAFQDQRDVRLVPGQTANVGGYSVEYVRPTAEVGKDRAGTGAPISLGAVLEVRKGDERFTARPARNYYPVRDPSLGPVARFFMGEATSEVDVRWGLRRDVWLAVSPDLAKLMPVIREADRRFGDVGAGEQAFLIAGIARAYGNRPPPANFRMIVSPLVSWIWIGGGIAVLGALLALWPGAESRRRAVSSVYAARLARELQRA